MDNAAAEFLDSGYLQPSQHEILRSALDDLLVQVRPQVRYIFSALESGDVDRKAQAVTLVDSFSVPDYVLSSALGRKEGKCVASTFSLLSLLGRPSRTASTKVWSTSRSASRSMVSCVVPRRFLRLSLDPQTGF